MDFPGGPTSGPGDDDGDDFDLVDDIDRRLDPVSRDRISALAQGLARWQEKVDAWRIDVDRRVARRTAFVMVALVAFMVGFVAAAGALRGLYERDSDRALDAARIVRQFQDAREQNARAACADENQLRTNLRRLGLDLGGRRLERVIARRFPQLDCGVYVHETLTTGRQPQPTASPSPSPSP